MENNLPMVIKSNFINKVINFFKLKFFMRKNSKIEVTENKIEFSNRREYLLDMQRKFEAGDIKEEDISKEDAIDLNKIYEEEITFLNGKIISVEAEIASNYMDNN